MSANLPAYTIQQLAPGSYDVLLDGSLVAALVRVAERQGTAHEWQIDLLDETLPVVRPSPFTAQSHTFGSLRAALDWLGIREGGVLSDAGDGQA